MTTELLETIAQLEDRVDELEWELKNAKDVVARLEDEVDDLERKLEDEEQINKDYRKVLLDIKLNIISAL